MKRDDVLALVATAIRDLNDELEYPSLQHVTEHTPIFGGEDSIDSLSLVRLLVDLETRLAAANGVSVILADDKAMSWRQSPYRTVGTLVDFIIAKTEQRDAGDSTETSEHADTIPAAVPSGE